MAIIKICNKRSFKRSLMYIGRDHATGNGEKKPAAYTSGILCSDDTKGAVQDFWLTQMTYNKTGGKRSAVEIIQSYPSSDKVTAEQVHQLGLELAHELGKLPYFSGHQMFLATHTDQRNGNLHNHLVANAVNLETGKKIQLPPDALPTIKAINDKICREHGLSVPTKGKTVNGEERDTPTANKTNTYAVLAAADNDKLESYIQDIGEKVIDVIKTATSREDFIKKLKVQGVGVNWSDTRKYITFEDLKRKASRAKKYKIRNKKLSQYYNINLEKEMLNNGFKKQIERIAAAERARRQLDRAADNSIGSSQRRDWQPATSITGTAAGKQQFKTGAGGSLQEDTELEQLRFGAAESGAAQSERKRAERDDQAEADRIANAEKLARAERERAKQERAATTKTATKSRSKGYSIGD